MKGTVGPGDTLAIARRICGGHGQRMGGCEPGRGDQGNRGEHQARAADSESVEGEFTKRQQSPGCAER